MIAMSIGIRCDVLAILFQRLASMFSGLRLWVIVTLTVDPAASNRMSVWRRLHSDQPEVS